MNSAASTVKRLLREARAGALATIMEESGEPYASLVAVASASDGSPLFLLSRLAVHTRNILADRRASLVLADGGADPLQSARVSLRGEVEATNDAASRRRYLSRQPGAEMFADFADFALYRMRLRAAHLVAGFGRIADVAVEQILTDVADAGQLFEKEQAIAADLNGPHRALLRAFIARSGGENEGDWQCVGCDPEGLDLQNGRDALRIVFGERVTSFEQIKRALS